MSETTAPEPLEEENAKMTVTATHPPIPDRIIEIREEVVKELTDPEYYGRTHGGALYKQGCRGPICLKASRAELRKAKGHKPRPGTEIIDAFIDFYAEKAIQIREELTQEFSKSLHEKVRAAIDAIS